MENLFKKIALTLTLTMFSTMIPFSVKASAEENQNPITRAWPGRPGGNGDGSEEWLQGNYGEPNGPFKTLYTSQGRVSDLNTQQSVADGIGVAIVDLLSGNVFKGTAALITSGAISAMGIAATIKGYYDGNYYKSVTYISGRCMKTVITTYEYNNYTGYIKTYEKWTKW
ncbi:hypothetical protein [Clostridium celatum]|nr:hypothetical protein [Clostridium celatum]MCE9653897.1 hypothetical protein [Clostridium celatum]